MVKFPRGFILDRSKQTADNRDKEHITSQTNHTMPRMEDAILVGFPNMCLELLGVFLPHYIDYSSSPKIVVLYNRCP